MHHFDKKGDIFNSYQSPELELFAITSPCQLSFMGIFKIVIALLCALIIGCSHGQPKTKALMVKKDLQCDVNADEHLKNSDYITGIDQHLAYLKANPDNGLAMYHLGYGYGQMGDLDSEIFWYKKAISAGYENADLYLNLGLAYGELQDMDESIEAFKKAISMDPANSEYHYSLGTAYEIKGDFTSSETSYLKAIELNPEFYEVRFFLARLYYKTGKLNEAKVQVNKVLEKEPGNEAALDLLGRINAQNAIQ